MKIFILVLSAFFISQIGEAQIKIYDIRCENRVNPLGIDIRQPRFSWKLQSGKRNVQQTAYEIRVYSGNKNIWSSGKKTSAESVFVPYDGPALESAKKYLWQVRTWDNQGNESDWSARNFWQMGLLNAADWKAKWIESGAVSDTVNGPAQLYRKEFDLKGEIKTATIFLTAHGIYEAMFNGSSISKDMFSPGWTSYNKRLQYQAYDVSTHVHKGKNAIGVMVGSGWYRTPLAWGNNRNLYGKKTGLLVQLEIEYTNGERETIVSDKSWKSTDNGPVRASEIYSGETYDSRLENQDWSKSSFKADNWKEAVEVNFPMDILVGTYNEPIRARESIQAVRIFKTPKGEQVVDFGQNLVGYEVMQSEGKTGDRIVVDHAEVLDKEGNFYTDNLRAAKSENIYILNGKKRESDHPHFTFHGFRYLRITGFPGELKPENIYALVFHSDMDTTGQFFTSNSMLNQLQHNIQWGQKGNFLDVPTDCPQRDERLGWTGDAQAFSATAAYNMDVHNFFAKWLKDVSADQGENGIVPFVVPNVLGPLAGGSAGWADVSTIIPWNTWLAYGDKKILEDQYSSMKGWIKFMQDHSTHFLWNKGFHFGDWLFYRPADDNDGRAAVTDKYLIAQCFFAHSTQLVIQAAEVLGKQEDIVSYRNLLLEIKKAFVNEYLTSSGRLVSGTQTAYVLALQFDMLPDTLRAQAAKRLADNIKDYGDHLTTGFLGTPYICHVLSRFGYDSVAYKLLLQETYPSWLYPVKMGATTIWERWDGQKPDSSFQTPGMNSFNHYAYGAIGDWMYRNIAGINIDETGSGYKKIIIRPRPGGNLRYAGGKLKTVYGEISVQWKISEGKFLMDVEIPANTTATICIPTASASSVQENNKPLSETKEIVVNNNEGNYLVLHTGSGIYHFSADLPK